MILVITLITGEWEDRIIAELVRNGYKVSAGIHGGDTTLETDVSTTLCLLVSKSGADDASEIANSVTGILKELEASYHNVVCFQGQSAIRTGTIYTSAKPPTESPKIPAAVAALLSDEDGL